MVSIRLFDFLHFSPHSTSDVLLDCGSAVSYLADSQQNLVYRAAQLLKQETGCDKGVKITLAKQIPAQAGLGGGSSDAASTLVALNRFWGLGLSSALLHSLAAKLGSDVNFFVDSPLAAVCTSRGESVLKAQFAGPLHFVVVMPEAGLSTAAVFSELSRNFSPETPQHESGSLQLDFGRVREIRNDLQVPAVQLNSKIEHVLHSLSRLGVVASGLTGSGAACFVICRTARHAVAIAGRCRSMRLGKVFRVSTGI